MVIYFYVAYKLYMINKTLKIISEIENNNEVSFGLLIISFGPDGQSNEITGHLHAIDSITTFGIPSHKDVNTNKSLFCNQ